MGCCLGCMEPRRDEVLAEYNPLILGDSVSATSNSMYAQRMMEYAERRIQPGKQELTNSVQEIAESIQELTNIRREEAIMREVLS